MYRWTAQCDVTASFRAAAGPSRTSAVLPTAQLRPPPGRQRSDAKRMYEARAYHHCVAAAVLSHSVAKRFAGGMMRRCRRLSANKGQCLYYSVASCRKAQASGPYSQELRVAIEAVLAASEVARAVAQSLSESMMEGKLSKADASPVTVADFGVQAVILKHISEQFPDDKICAEENADGLRKAPDLLELVLEGVRVVEPKAAADEVCVWIDKGVFRDTKGEQRFWTLDPIDGTKGFLRRQQYALCLALIVDGKPAVAAQACPNLTMPESYMDDLSKKLDFAMESPGAMATRYPGSLFYAAEGCGTWMRAMPPRSSPLWSSMRAFKAVEDMTTQLQLPQFDGNQMSDLRFCESYESSHSSHGDAEQVSKKLRISKPALRMDSQVKYGVICRNEAQVLLRLPGGLTGGSYKENIWDHASGTLLLSEAGGLACDSLGKPLDFSQGHKLFHNKGIVAAASPELLRRVVAAVADVREQQAATP